MALNIDILSRLVKDLLMDNDRVTLPGLGYFFSETQPAKFTDDGHSITPPHKCLSFRKGNDCDRLLIEAYSRYCKIDKTESEKIMKQFITEMTSVLFNYKTIVFPELGKLRATRENNIFFVCDENCSIYPETIGLRPIALSSIRQEIIFQDVVPEKMDESNAIQEEIIAEPALETVPSEESTVTTTEIVDKPAEIPSVTTVQGHSFKKGSIEEYRYHRDRQDRRSELSEKNIESEKEYSGKCKSGKQVGSLRDAFETKTKSDTDSHSDRHVHGKVNENNSRIKTAVICILSLLFTVAVIYFILLKVSPDFIDSILYNEEELEIIHFFGR